MNCDQICGNCSYGQKCSHVNGSCLNGCAVGVYGDKCDNGKRKNVFFFVVIVIKIINSIYSHRKYNLKHKYGIHFE